jgi:hypothetical protein
MSTKTKQKQSAWGGYRNGSGRKLNSGEKTKICVSVHEENWNSAVRRWKKKPSWLVDRLILGYLTKGGSVLGSEAAI